MAVVLVIPGAYAMLTVWLALYGLWHLRGFTARVWSPSLEVGGLAIWLGMLVYVVVGIGLGWWHAYKASYFEAYVPMLLSPFIVNAVVVARPPQAMLWLGAASGAILSGLVASYQSLYLQIGRAIGAMNNEIMFGDLSVVLVMFSALGWLYWAKDKQQTWIRWYLLLGVLMGMWASLLSGTKGGWLSILMLAVVLVWLVYSHWHWAKRNLAAFGVLASIGVLVSLAPHDLVVNRVISGLQGAHIWFNTGQITEGSVSIRLEKWNQATDMIADRPWSGWTTNGSREELSRRMVATGAGEGWIQTENDFLQAGVVHGLPAIISYIFFYAGFIWWFSRVKRISVANPAYFSFALAGILLPILMLEFGLSVVVLGRNAFRHTLIVWSMILMGYLISVYLANHENGAKNKWN